MKISLGYWIVGVQIDLHGLRRELSGQIEVDRRQISVGRGRLDRAWRINTQLLRLQLLGIDILRATGDARLQTVQFRPEERRVGKEGVSQCRSRGSPEN